MTMEQRVERLERQNKWMRRIGAVAVALVAAVFLMGQGKAEKLPELEARSLKLKDKDGNVRLMLLATDTVGMPYIGLDASDKRGGMVSLGYAPDRTAILLFTDRTGSVKVTSRGLVFWDSSHKVRAVFGLDKGGAPHLDLYNAKGDVIWQAPKEK